MATRDYRSTSQPSQPPPHLPNWMLALDPYEQSYGPQSPGFRVPQMGSAEMDQYAAQGQNAVMPSGGLGERILGRGVDQSDFLSKSFYPKEGYVGMSSQGMGTYSAPTMGDRLGRGLMGAVNGFDFNNKTANIAADFSSAVPVVGQALGALNRGAGVYQGLTSDAPDFDKGLPSQRGMLTGLNAPAYQNDIMPRGIMADGGLTPQAMGGGGGDRNALNYAVGGTSQGGGDIRRWAGGVPPPNDVGSYTFRNGEAGPRANTGFTGGSGAMVDPYTLPGESDLLSLLSNPERYGGYDASTGRTGMAGSGAQGGGYQYAGYDFAQDPGNRDIGKSAKYAWAEATKILASRGVPMPRTKAEAAAYAEQAAPIMAQMGFPISDIIGDKFSVAAREGQDNIDWLINADGENPTLGWQSEVLAPGGPMATGGGMQGGGRSLPTSGMDLTSSDLFAALMAQAQAMANGQATGANPADTQALITLLLGGR